MSSYHFLGLMGDWRVLGRRAAWFGVSVSIAGERDSGPQGDDSFNCLPLERDLHGAETGRQLVAHIEFLSPGFVPEAAGTSGKLLDSAAEVPGCSIRGLGPAQTLQTKHP